jgi:pyruvate/2-oxoglutarate dehydrogenase complex dihydrolipoamide acyltransferase (E2) component
MSRALLIVAPVTAVLAWVAVAASQPAGQASDARETPATAPATAPAPASRPASQPSPDAVLGEMLKPRRTGTERELNPTEPPAVDKTTGPGSVAPRAPVLTVLREGTPIVNRVGRVNIGADGAPSEFVFESDGQALRDPPMLLIPNLRLVLMEDTARNNTREPRFRVSGVVTEYRGRNYLLLDKVTVTSQATQQYR